MSKTTTKAADNIIDIAGPHGEHFRMGWMCLTPVLAEKYLSNQGFQRELKPKVAADYAAAMRNGKWDDVVGDPLLFDTKGRLMSGQHRCKAVIMSEHAIYVFVIRGIRDDAYYNIDDGHPRSLEDTLHIEGEKNAKQLSVVVKSLYQFSLGQESANKPITVDNRTAYQFLKHHPGLPKTVTMTNSRINTMPIRLASVPAMAYVTYVLEHIAMEPACRFLRIMFNESAPKPESGCPASLMVRKLQESRNPTQRQLRLTARERLANIIKAWNYFVAERRVPGIRSITWRIDEEWPKFQDAEGNPVPYSKIQWNSKS